MKIKKITKSVLSSLTQAAFGADATLTSNPDIWKIMEHTRNNGIIPNITCANISDEVADNLAKYCGAVAVSRYEDKNLCYDSVKKLTDRGMSQINIHMLVSNQTYDMVMETFKDIQTDPRLEKLNAIVLLSLKQKGRGVNYSTLSQEKFNTLIEYVDKNNISYGCDSCSAHKTMIALRGHERYEELIQSIEPCESSCFSVYIDTHGKFYPCSFTPKSDDWQEGLDVLSCDNFINDIWFNQKTNMFRSKLLSGNRNCPLFEV